MSAEVARATAGQQTVPPVDIFDILLGGPSLRLAYINACKCALPEGATVIPTANRELVYGFGDCVNKNGVVVAGPAAVPMLIFMWWAIVYVPDVSNWFCTDPACAPVCHLRNLAAQHIHGMLVASPGHMSPDQFAMVMLAEVEMLRPMTRAASERRSGSYGA